MKIGLINGLFDWVIEPYKSARQAGRKKASIDSTNTRYDGLTLPDAITNNSKRIELQTRNYGPLQRMIYSTSYFLEDRNQKKVSREVLGL